MMHHINSCYLRKDILYFRTTSSVGAEGKCSEDDQSVKVVFRKHCIQNISLCIDSNYKIVKTFWNHLYKIDKRLVSVLLLPERLDLKIASRCQWNLNGNSLDYYVYFICKGKLCKSRHIRLMLIAKKYSISN